MRVAPPEGGVGRQSDGAEQAFDRSPPLARVHLEHLVDGSADPHRRVERRRGILRDVGDPPAAQRPERTLVAERQACPATSAVPATIRVPGRA